METKKFFAVILSVLLIFSFTACTRSNSTITPESQSESLFESQSETNSESQHQSTSASVIESIAEGTNTTECSTTENNTTATKIYERETTPTETETTTHISTTASASTATSEWSKQQIVDTYKKAAKKTHPNVKSQHSIEITEMSVNNGEFANVFEFITPIMSKLLANNTEDKDGITGGYNNLVPEDVAAAKIYKSGEFTIIEMTMKNQVSGPKEDALSGSVGHAITAVGDISSVTNQLKDLGLPLEISDDETKIIFTNPTVKVKIDSNGIIVNGTWQYTVEIRLDNYKVFGKDVETTSIVMLNTLTLNGGFKK